MTRLLTIAAHEVREQLRSPALLALLLLVVAATSTINPILMLTHGADAGEASHVAANSVYALSPTFAVSGFFVYPFFVALMAGLSVLRDEERGIAELIHSTPLTRREYVWAKFSGVLLTLAIAIMLHVLVVLSFRELGVGGVTRGPFRPLAYVLAAGVFLVPSVLWCAGVTFALGARTRQPMVVYAVPVALFVLEFVLLWNWRPAHIDPTLDTLLMVLDPTALRWLSHALFATDRGIAWYNTAPLAIDSVLVLNRLFTIALPLAAVALQTRRSRSTEGPSWQAMLQAWQDDRATRRANVAPLRARSHTRAAVAPHTVLNRLSRSTPSIGAWSGTLVVLRSELRLLQRQPSLYLTLAVLVAVVAELGGAEQDVYGSTAIATAGLVAVQALPAITVLGCLALLFVIVETFHRDQASGFEAIAHSMPIPTAALVYGRAMAAGVLVLVIVLACVATGSALVMMQSRSVSGLWPLPLVFGAVLVPTLLVWIAFVTAVMTRLRSRVGAIAVGLVALLLTAAQFVRGSLNWVTNWPLWGALRWTDFAVFPLDGEALVLNRLTAIGLAFGLLVGAGRWYERTERDRAAQRARRSPPRIALTVLRAASLLLLPAFTGTFLAVRMRQDPGMPASSTREDRPPALLHHIDLAVTLEPVSHGLAVDGVYHLTNRSLDSLRLVAFTVPSAFGSVTWAVNGVPVRTSRLAGVHLVQLIAPLGSGDSLRVGFQYRTQVPFGLSRNGGPVDAFILPSSVLFSTHRGDFLPIPAPHPRAVMRPAASVPSEGDEGTGYFNSGWRFTARMLVRAPRELTMIGVGEQMATSTRGNTTTTVWETRTPVSALSLVGGRFAVQRLEGVAVFHHPAHTASVDAMLQTLAAARRHYATWFHPYPWNELRLSEYADLSTQATSYPSSIAFSEGMGFLTRAGADGGLAFAVTAHEAAHQWWGHLLTAGTGPGTGLLIEGMADYSMLLLAEETLGADARGRLAVVLEQQYLAGRAAEREQPLSQTRESTAADETVLQKKGAWAMWMLHRSLGDDATFAALRSFITTHRAPDRFATLDGLLRALRGSATDTIRFDADVAQWFHGTGLPEFRLDAVRCVPANAQWQCVATLHNIGTGRATVEITALRGTHRLANATQRVSIAAGDSHILHWRLPTRPERLVVDPDILVLQAGRARARAEL